MKSSVQPSTATLKFYTDIFVEATSPIDAARSFVTTLHENGGKRNDISYIFTIQEDGVTKTFTYIGSFDEKGKILVKSKPPVNNPPSEPKKIVEKKIPPIKTTTAPKKTLTKK